MTHVSGTIGLLIWDKKVLLVPLDRWENWVAYLVSDLAKWSLCYWAMKSLTSICSHAIGIASIGQAECRLGELSAILYQDPEACMLLDNFRSLSSKLCHTKKEVKESSSWSCHYDPILVHLAFLFPIKPIPSSQSTQRAHPLSQKTKRRRADGWPDQTGHFTLNARAGSQPLQGTQIRQSIQTNYYTSELASLKGSLPLLHLAVHPKTQLIFPAARSKLGVWILVSKAGLWVENNDVALPVSWQVLQAPPTAGGACPAWPAVRKSGLSLISIPAASHAWNAAIYSITI